MWVALVYTPRSRRFVEPSIGPNRLRPAHFERVARAGQSRGRVEYLDALRDSGGKVLASAQATVEGKGISCKTVLAENVAGNVADIIVERARELQADVIVMRAQGRRGVRRLVLGGDVEGVVRTSPVPVLLVRGDTEPRTS